MNEEKARSLISGAIRPDNSLGDDGGCWMHWPDSGVDSTRATGQIDIEGRLTVEELEAIVWWMRNMHVYANKV